MAAISGTGTSRPDGAAYIDVQDPAQAGDGDVDHEELERHASGSTSGSSSGSSVVEGEDDEGPPDWGPDDEGLLPPRDTAGSEDEDELYYEGEEEEWDVEDEDWELAHGDFTKHYNRARQQQAAMTSTKEPTMLLNGGTTLAKPPLPSRNVHVNQQQLHAQKKNQIAGPSTTSALSSRQVNALKFTGGVSTNPKAGGEKQEKDKSDRATQEQVLDNRTRLVLKSLGGRGVITKIENCISTGKEANVYYSTTGSNEDLAYKGPVAVKIYRTSILNFRSRQNYIVGEQRFKGEYTSSKNPRKMIKVWAEKELRNLRRLKSGGIRTPVVLECRENVLVMEFLGTDGGPSPRLKDAEIPEEELPMLYAEMIVGMRRIYQHCHLVHADLSEYNVLYHDSHLYIIDVSQSVEHDHPRSFDFLRMDIRNVKDYFARRSNGAFPMLSLRRTWDFIVNEELDGINRSEETSESGEEKLLDSFRDLLDKYAIEQQDEEGAADKARQDELDDDAVFMSSYIPKNLSEIYDPERDVELVNQGKGANLIYAGVTGLNDVKRRNDKTAIEGYPESAIQEATTSTAAKSPKNTEPAPASTTKEQDSEAAKETTEESLPSALKDLATVDTQLSGGLEKKVRFDDEEDVDAESVEDEEEEDHENRPRGFRHEDKESKKERKKAVKEEQREKRKTKMAKAEKQRLIKKSSR